MSTHELTEKVKELKSLQTLIEEATAEIEGIKDELKKEMGEAEEIRVGDYKVRYTTVTSSRVDTVALKKAMPDIAEAFTRTSVTRRFSIA